jgi:hypothetical protein
MNLTNSVQLFDDKKPTKTKLKPKKASIEAASIEALISPRY